MVFQAILERSAPVLGGRALARDHRPDALSLSLIEPSRPCWTERGRVVLAALTAAVDAAGVAAGFAAGADPSAPRGARWERAPARPACGLIGKAAQAHHLWAEGASAEPLRAAAARALAAERALRALLGLELARVDLEAPPDGGHAADALGAALAEAGLAPWISEVPAGRPARALLWLGSEAGPLARGASLRAGGTQGLRLEGSLVGALDELLAAVLEANGGRLPLAVAPEQARVLPVGRAQRGYAAEVARTLADAGARVTLASDRGPLPARVARAARERVPWTLVVGAREARERAVTLRAAAPAGEARLRTLPLSQLPAALERALHGAGHLDTPPDALAPGAARRDGHGA